MKQRHRDSDECGPSNECSSPTKIRCVYLRQQSLPMAA